MEDFLLGQQEDFFPTEICKCATNKRGCPSLTLWGTPYGSHPLYPHLFTNSSTSWGRGRIGPVIVRRLQRRTTRNATTLIPPGLVPTLKCTGRRGADDFSKDIGTFVYRHHSNFTHHCPKGWDAPSRPALGEVEGSGESRLDGTDMEELEDCLHLCCLWIGYSPIWDRDF